MKFTNKLLIAGLLIITFPFLPLKSQQANLVEEYQEITLVVTGIEASLESLFAIGDIDSLIKCLPLSGRERAAYEKWFSDQHKIGKPLAIDSLSCRLPVLGFSPGKGFIQNGRFEIFVSGPDTSYTGFVRFREMGIELIGGVWKLVPFKPDTGVTPAEVTVTNSSFNVSISGNGYLVDVGLIMDIRNDSSEPIARLPVMFRFPYIIKGIKCGGIELRGDHFFIEASGNRVHECILNLPQELLPGGKVRLEFIYTLDFSNHQLNNKLAGISADRGYIVMESGWYPWLSHDFVTIPCTTTVTVPEKWLAFAPGKATGTDLTDGGKRFSYAENGPTWPFLVWGDYHLYQYRAGKGRFDLYLAGDSEVEQPWFGNLLTDIWSEFEQVLPRPELEVQRIISVTRHGGYGPPGSLLLEDAYMNREMTPAAEITELVAHELSHSWINSIAQPGGEYAHFISEGLATYLGAYMVERINGPDEARKIWERNIKEYLNIANDAVAPADLTNDLMYSNNQVYRGVVYFKGAYFFRQIEKLVGAGKMKKVLNTAIRVKNNRIFTLGDIRNALRKANGPVDWLFGGFLETTELPDYFITGCGDPVDGNFVVRRTGPDVALPVKVTSFNGEGIEMESVNISLMSDSLMFSFKHEPCAISKIIIDPDHELLQSEIRNDIFPDYIVSEEDREMIAIAISELFKLLENHRQEEVLGLFSEDRSLVPARLKAGIAGAASNWSYKNASPGDLRFFGRGNGVADCSFNAELDSGGKRIVMSVEASLKKEGDWKFINIRFSLVDPAK